MYFPDVLQDGNPEFLAAVGVVLAAIVQSQAVGDSGIARHPYASPSEGGKLASDLPDESIGRPDVELLWTRRTRKRRSTRG